MVGCDRCCSIRFLGVSFSSLSRNLDDKRDPSFVARHSLGGARGPYSRVSGLHP